MAASLSQVSGMKDQTENVYGENAHGVDMMFRDDDRDSGANGAGKLGIADC